eukprot:793011-Prorocentrum_minimum.AAC.1
MLAALREQGLIGNGKSKATPEKPQADHSPPDGKDEALVGNLFSAFADKRTGYADINDENVTAVAQTAAKSAHIWKNLLKKKHENACQEDKRVMKVVFGDEVEDDQHNCEDATEAIVAKAVKNRFKTPTVQIPEEEYSLVVSHDTASWLRKRGYKVPTDLTKKQKLELQECFELIDKDGNGHIDAQELYQAFTYLGVEICPKVTPSLPSIRHACSYTHNPNPTQPTPPASSSGAIAFAFAQHPPPSDCRPLTVTVASCAGDRGDFQHGGLGRVRRD